MTAQTYDTPAAWYHWSPRSRRAGIRRAGLVPGKLSRDGLWRPPFVCLSSTPLLALDLSANVYAEEGEPWDLWAVQDGDIPAYEVIVEDYREWDGTGNSHYMKEIRVYERIYKRDLTWLAERTP